MTVVVGHPRVVLLPTLVQKTYPSGVQEIYPGHEPVLLRESLALLDLKPGQVAVDCTLGLGGHSSEILKAIGPKGHLYAFERDERNLKVARSRLEKIGNNFTLFHDNFSSLTDRLRREGASHADAILFDLGLSSPHIDEASRGFSFLREGPLDMRFDTAQGKTAADLLNTLGEAQLADIFFHFGEIHASRKLAHAILQTRKINPFQTTTQFAQFVRETLGKSILPQAFQALRIAVNEELMALELGLNQAIELLAPHGRVVVLSYHSLEDRLVKQTFKQRSTDLRDPNDTFGTRVLRSKSLSLLTKKPIKASAEELARNPRARSAVLRAAERLAQPSL